VDAIREKCDVATRDVLESNDPNRRLEVLVRIAGSAPSLQGELERSGLEVHSTIGPIATGVIAAGRLSHLTALPFVRRVELSRTLFQEK
jgi:hypothetical protein